jgi:CRP-like cAMP-binding protein
MMLMKTRLNHGQDQPDPVARAFECRDAGRANQVARRHEDLFAGTDGGAASQHFDPEQRLYARGASGGCAYIIASGLVRFERVTAAGGRRIIRIAGSGDLIGQEALLRQAHRDDAVACTPRSRCAAFQHRCWTLQTARRAACRSP